MIDHVISLAVRRSLRVAETAVREVWPERGRMPWRTLGVSPRVARFAEGMRGRLDPGTPSGYLLQAWADTPEVPSGCRRAVLLSRECRRRWRVWQAFFDPSRHFPGAVMVGGLRVTTPIHLSCHLGRNAGDLLEAVRDAWPDWRRATAARFLAPWGEIYLGQRLGPMVRVETARGGVVGWACRY